MTNEQANEMVLAWCRSEGARRNGRVPVMRTYNDTACVIDASFIDWTADGATLASGADWIEVCAQLGVYGPQWEPAPVKRAEPPPHYGYRHRPLRGYGRGRR